MVSVKVLVPIFKFVFHRSQKLLIASRVNGSKIILSGQAPAVKATEVRLNVSSLNWTVGQTGKFTATILPVDTTNKGLTWTTSDIKVATIDQNGYIKAVGVGSAVITCRTSDGSNKIATCKVIVTKVNNIKVTSVKLDSANLSVGKGKTTQLKATVAPVAASNKNLIWRTGDMQIATIDQNGQIKGMGIGTTTLYCMTKDGDFKISTCKVTVTK